jgi:superfamily I DNA/RNA helicase
MIVVDYKGLSTYLSKRFAKYFAPDETAFHLVRTNYGGVAIAKILAEMGTPFGGICGWTHGEIQLFHAIAKIKEGRTPTATEYKKLIDHVKKTDLQYKGTKEELKTFFENNAQQVNALNNWYLSNSFVQAVRAGNPGEHLTNADSMLKLKINGMLKNGVQAIDESRINRIQILTIHGAKGLEATHVFLHAAVPPIVKQGTLTTEGRANEAYVWYVAITRTMKNLIVVSYPGKNYPIPRMCA